MLLTRTAELVAHETTHKVKRWAILGLSTPPVIFLSVAVLAAMGIGTIPDPGKGCGPNGSVGVSADIPSATRDGINALRGSYQQAAEQTGVSWTLLAGVDYRENNNAPDRSALSGEPLGTTNPDSGVVTSTKLDSLIRAGEHLTAMASSVYGVTLSTTSGGDDVKLALLAYNRGSIYKAVNASPDLSPYVMNQADVQHTDMTWPDIPGEPLAGQKEYGHLGGYVVFVRIGGSAAPGCSGLSDSDIVAVAQGELGHHEIPDGCNCGPEVQPYLGSSSGEQWCADFTSWVYMTAGHPFSGGQDGNWRIANVSVLHQWLVDNGIWMDRGSSVLPQPGDVITFRDDEHVGIVEKVEGLTVGTIEGNTSNSVARRTYSAEGEGTENGPQLNGQIVGYGRQRVMVRSG